jgi:CubicO group peptidase (beta-lactamase class C family)
MKRSASLTLLIVGLALLIAPARADAGAGFCEVPVPSIPRIEGIAVDGDPGDWEDRGFRIALLTSDDLQVPPTDDLDPECRVAWTAQGLFVLVTVLDDVAFECDRDDALWEADSVELFVAADPETAAHAQYIVSPGIDPKHPDPRIQPYDRRADTSEEMAADIEVAEQEGGYVLEMLFPWTNLGLAPAGGEEIGFQVFVNDSDRADERFTAIWYPLMRTEGGSRASHAVCLAESASRPARVSAHGSYDRFRRIKVNVAAAGELTGETVELCSETGVLAGAELAAEDGNASAELAVPLPRRGQPVPAMGVFMDGECAAPVELSDLERARARALIRAAFHFRPYVFGGSQFPECDFEQPSFAEDLLGPYAIERTFYDAYYNEVAAADTPGRYGAVVEVVPEHGRPLTLYRTLFRLPEGYDLPWFPRGSGLEVRLPPTPGMDPRVFERQAGAINDVFWMLFRGSFDREPNIAALASGLLETSPNGGSTTVADDILAQDRQWWVGLKRKLYGMEDIYPDSFVCPRPKEGKPAPVLREGTPEEAGMDPGGVKAVDALLQEWAADTDEGFAVCLARHGIVFLHKAYGERDGRPMTVTDVSWDASITKLLSGTLTMMLVDQGLVDLDDSVDKFLPPFRGVEVETPMTIRHLYTHTCGLWDHWGDELHDFDQLIGYYYPYLDVGERFEYNGAGYSVAGKIIELVSGEAIPQFYKRHLLDPLGCENLEVFGNSWDSRAAPLDLAKVGQVLLSRGSYGDMEFFSEETFEQMKQERLTKVLGPDTTEYRGIGVYHMFEDEFGKGTFGHGAASSADLIISPEKDMVVIMTRNAAGESFGKYHPKFVEAVTDAIAE